MSLTGTRTEAAETLFLFHMYYLSVIERNILLQWSDVYPPSSHTPDFISTTGAVVYNPHLIP